MTPQLRRRAEASGGDAEGLEDVGGERRLEGEVRDPLDRGTDDDVPEVGVQEAAGPMGRSLQRGGGAFRSLLTERPRVPG